MTSLYLWCTCGVSILSVSSVTEIQRQEALIQKGYVLELKS